MTYSLKKLNNCVKQKTDKHNKLFFKSIKKSKKNIRKHKSSSRYTISNRINKKFIHNKHKYILVGGDKDDNILFGCTTMAKDSTLTKNFKLINATIRQYIPGTTLKAFLLYKVPRFTTDILGIRKQLQSKYNEQQLTDSGYEPIEVHDINIMDFIKKEENLYRMIVLAECSSLLQTLLSEELKYPVSNVALKYCEIEQQIFSLYNKIVNDGHLVIFYYGIDFQTQLTDIDDFSATIDSTKYLPFVIYSILIMKQLFTQVSTGIYKKNNDITTEKYKSICSITKGDFFTRIKQYIDNDENVIKLKIELETIPPIDEWKKTTISIYNNIRRLFNIKDINDDLLLLFAKINYVDKFIIPYIL